MSVTSRVEESEVEGVGGVRVLDVCRLGADGEEANGDTARGTSGMSGQGKGNGNRCGRHWQLQ